MSRRISTFGIISLSQFFGCVSTDFDFRWDAGQTVPYDSGFTDSGFMDSGFMDSGFVDSNLIDSDSATVGECSENSQCTSETASACVEHDCKPCASNMDCEHILRKNVCRSQGASTVSCVQCALGAENACG